MNRRLSIIIGSAALAVVVVIALVVVLANHKSSNDGTKTPTVASSTGTSTGASTSPSGAPTTGSISSLVPPKGVLFGAWAASPDHSEQGRINAVNTFDSDLGVDLPIVHIYRKLDQQIDTSSTLHEISLHKKLLISWAGGDTVEMASGRLDSTIAQRAREVAALGVPVYFEYRWEMDRPNLQPVTHNGADFIAAWDRVRQIFAQQHVTNAAFVWCPQANGFPSNRAQQYYPGDDEVDWICADVYPLRTASIQSFATLSASFLKWAVPHHKPIMFGEIGVFESFGSQRAAWLTDIGPVLTMYPQIKAVVYFNGGSNGVNLYLDKASPPAEAFTALVKKYSP